MISTSASITAWGYEGVRESNIFTLSLTSRIATLCRSCLTISSSSLPVCRLTCLPSFVITSKESLCHPPKVSTTRGMNTIPSASHLSLYFPTLMLKACWTPFSPSLATCPTSCCCRGLTTETSSAASLPLAQKGSRTSAGRSSLPGRSPAGSFRGPRASWDAAARRMKWSIRNKKQWTRNSPEEASTWLAPPHEAETFSGSNVCNRNHFFLPLDLRDDDDCSESPRVPTAQLRRLVFFASPTSLFPKTPPSLHQSPNIPPFTSLVHVLAEETFWYFSSFFSNW